MAVDTVLDLLLTARYLGGPAFGAMTADIDRLTAKVDGMAKLGGVLDGVGTALTGLGVVAGIGLGGAVAAATGYADAMQRIAATSPDLQQHADVLKQLSTQIQAVSSAYGQSPTETARGTYFLTSSLPAIGANVPDLLKSNVISQLMQYSVASGPVSGGGVSYSDAAQVLPRILTASGLPLGQWGGALGLMTWLENSTHQTQAQLSSAMTSFLPIMAGTGMSFADSATFLSAVASSGRVGSPAGREAMSAIDLMLTGGPEQKTLHSLGLSNASFYGQNGQLLPMPQIMQILQAGLYSHATTPGSLLTLEKGLFGQVGQRVMGPFFGAGYQRYQDLLKAEGAAGVNTPGGALAYMQRVSASMMQAPGNQLGVLKSKLETLAIAIGTTLLPVVLRLATAFGNIASHLTAFVSAHPAMTQALATAAVPALLGSGLGLKVAGYALEHHKATGALLDTVIGNPLSGLAGLGSGAYRGLPGFLGGIPGKLGGMFGALGNARDAAFPSTMLAHAMTRQLGGNPEVGMVRGLATDLGRLKDTGITKFFDGLYGAVDRVVGMMTNFGGVIVKAAFALPAIAAAGAPVVLAILLIVGAITTIVLLFTRFHTEGMQIASFLGGIFGPAFHAVLGMVGLMVAQLGKTWQQVEPQVSAAMKQLVAGVESARPFFVALAAVFVLVGAIVIGVIGNLVGAFLKMLPTIIAIFTGIFRVIGDITNLVIAIFTGQWGKIPGILLSLLGDAFGIVKNLLGLILGFVGGFVGGIIAWFQGLFDRLVGHSIIPDMVNAILSWFLQLGTKALTLVQTGIATLTSFLSGLPEKFLTLGQNIINGLVNGLRNGLGAVGNVVGQLGNKLSSIPLVGGLLPHFAAGGDMPYSGFALVGERGPELVRLPAGAHVFPHGGLGGIMPSNLRVASLHVDNLHMPTPQPRQPEYKPLAETFEYSRRIQAQREASYSRYQHNLAQFDADYRRSWQYTQ